MAKNVVYNRAERLGVVCTDPASPVSGDPVLYGQQPGVALTSKNATTNITSVQMCGVATFSVKAVTTAAAGSAVAEGDVIYYVPGNTPKLSKAVGDAGAVRFGVAMGAITSGSTATIPVRIGY